MLRHTEECRSRGIPFVADPSQQLAFADGPEIRALVDGAAYLFTNEYEAHLTEQKTGWTAGRDRRAGSTSASSRAAGTGVTIDAQGRGADLTCRWPGEVAQADPTGVGDAFRAGFLAGLAGGLDLRALRPARARCSRPT